MTDRGSKILEYFINLYMGGQCHTLPWIAFLACDNHFHSQCSSKQGGQILLLLQNNANVFGTFDWKFAGNFIFQVFPGCGENQF